MKVSDILEKIEHFAPLGLALEWDNVGLLVGEREAEIRRVLISLDFTANTLKEAITLKADLILTHHPIWLRGVKKLNDPLILDLIRHGINLISLHTNLDTARYSVNHALAKILGLEEVEILSPETGNQQFAVHVKVPLEAVESVREAAFKAGAGVLGKYDRCSSQLALQGSFRPIDGSNPYIGSHGIESHVREEKLEFIVGSSYLAQVIGAIKQIHPYEQPCLNHFAIKDTDPGLGLGLVCANTHHLSLKELTVLCKEKLGGEKLRLWLADREETEIVDRIALCGGSGASVIGWAARKAEVLISGDLSYHSLMESPIPLIDAGHFHTEYPSLQYLRAKMMALGLETFVLDADKHEFVLRSKWI